MLRRSRAASCDDTRNLLERKEALGAGLVALMSGSSSRISLSLASMASDSSVGSPTGAAAPPRGRRAQGLRPQASLDLNHDAADDLALAKALEGVVDLVER